MVDAMVFAPLHRNTYLRKLGKPAWVPCNVIDYPPRTARLFVNASQLLARHMISKWCPDIIHHTYYDSAYLTTPHSRRVITVYDMIHEKFRPSKGKNLIQSEQKRRAVLAADHVIAISHSTSIDLQEMWGVPSDKITVIHLAAQPFRGDIGEPGKTSAAKSTRRPFLLYVGLREGYKNFDSLLQAIASSPQLRKDFDLIAFGGRPFSRTQYDAIIHYGLDPSKVIHRSGDDQVLASHYRSAATLVYPSLYEGFGLPPLEAMKSGLPVCVSNTSSLPEVVGDAGEYFDPTDPESIASAVERVVYNPDLASELSKKGRIRATEFTWNKCADATTTVYRKLR